MKEFFLPLTEPVGAVWAVMAAGVVWLIFKRQWRGIMWLGSPTVLLFFLGSTPLIEAIVGREEETVVRRLESAGRAVGTTDNGLQTTDHGPRTADDGKTTADVVVVLGGGVRMSDFDRFGFAPTDAFARIMAGLELVRQGRARTLVLGGSYPYPGKPELPSMVAVQAWLGAWSLTSVAVTNLGICYNTHDEAVVFKSLYESQSWKSVILVTSALHMKRSVALFQKLGIVVEPAPADFEVYGVSQDSHFSIFPRLHRFRLWALYLHERIGWWVYGMKGWV